MQLKASAKRLAVKEFMEWEKTHEVGGFSREDKEIRCQIGENYDQRGRIRWF